MAKMTKEEKHQRNKDNLETLEVIMTPVIMVYMFLMFILDIFIMIPWTILFVILGWITNWSFSRWLELGWFMPMGDDTPRNAMGLKKLSWKYLRTGKED